MEKNPFLSTNASWRPATNLELDRYASMSIFIIFFHQNHLTKPAKLGRSGMQGPQVVRAKLRVSWGAGGSPSTIHVRKKSFHSAKMRQRGFRSLNTPIQNGVSEKTRSVPPAQQHTKQTIFPRPRNFIGGFNQVSLLNCLLFFFREPEKEKIWEFVCVWLASSRDGWLVVS